jgi:hypothetical protein
VKLIPAVLCDPQILSIRAQCNAGEVLVRNRAIGSTLLTPTYAVELSCHHLCLSSLEKKVRVKW